MRERGAKSEEEMGRDGEAWSGEECDAALMRWDGVVWCGVDLDGSTSSPASEGCSTLTWPEPLALIYSSAWRDYTAAALKDAVNETSRRAWEDLT